MGTGGSAQGGMVAGCGSAQCWQGGDWRVVWWQGVALGAVLRVALWGAGGSAQGGMVAGCGIMGTRGSAQGGRVWHYGGLEAVLPVCWQGVALWDWRQCWQDGDWRQCPGWYGGIMGTDWQGVAAGCGIVGLEVVLAVCGRLAVCGIMGLYQYAGRVGIMGTEAVLAGCGIMGTGRVWHCGTGGSAGSVWHYGD